MRPSNRHRSPVVVRAEQAYLARKRVAKRMEFYIDEAGKWRWRLKAANGEIVGASSEGFERRATAVGNAMRLLNALRSWAQVSEKEIIRDEDGT